MTTTVLTVDDLRSMRDMLKHSLSEAGYRVVQAEDGVHGLEVLETETPDVIVTDINMPRLDGFGFIEAVRRGCASAGHADAGFDHRGRCGKEAARQGCRCYRLDREAV